MRSDDVDVTQYLQEGLFRLVPHRRRFLLFGEQCTPGSVVDASCILSASIGVVAGAEWPERTTDLLRVAPGFEVADVVERRAGRVEARMNDAKSVARQYKLWLVADIGEAAVSYTSWARRRLASALCGGSFFDGAAVALKRTGSLEIVAGWITGVRDVWGSACDAQLAIDAEPPFDGYASWVSIIDVFLDSYEGGLPIEEGERFASPPWRSLEQIWRLEAYRIALMARARISWRDASATSGCPGLL